MKLANTFDDGWELDDGEALHGEAPGTFYIPPVGIQHSLSVGQIVKLMFRISLEKEDGTKTQEVERMWVIVQRCLVDGQYLGELNNDPHCTKGIQSGMAVIFEPRHVIQVYQSAA